MRSRYEILEHADRAAIRCIEAGLLPEGVLVLYRRDPVARARRILAAASVIFAAALVVQGALQLRAPVAFGLAIALGLVGVLVTPTIAPGDEGRRRPAIVVTATAILKREALGFRSWMFAELVCAQLSIRAERIDLVLVGADGTRSFIDCGALESGRQLVEIVTAYLPTTMI